MKTLYTINQSLYKIENIYPYSISLFIVDDINHPFDSSKKSMPLSFFGKHDLPIQSIVYTSKDKNIAYESNLFPTIEDAIDRKRLLLEANPMTCIKKHFLSF